MLKQRILTAIVLAALFLAAVIGLSPTWLAVVFGLAAMAGAWEWSLLAGLSARWQRMAFCLVLAGLLVAGWFVCDLAGSASRELVQPWLGVACFFWSVAMLLVESYPGTSWLWRSRLLRTLMGLLIIFSAWLALVYLDTLKNGPLLIILLVVAVAAADIGAYFSGRRWGRHKLAPHVSPGKTWEGLWGGLVAVMLVTFLVWGNLPAAYSHLEIAALALLGLAVAGASVLGDLTVSMVKRTSGVKDSGAMLPGHGGLLDRIDSICGAAPVFALGLMLMGY